MNYDLAIMSLEGLSRSPLRIIAGADGVTIEGSGASFKELARLCLLLGGESGGEPFDLQPGIHIEKGSNPLHLRRQD